MSRSQTLPMPPQAMRPSPILQRLYRGVDGLLAPLQVVDDRPAREILDPQPLALYLRESKADRLHSLRVFAWLQTVGHNDPDLLTAALLHDCGKAAARLRVWQRTLKVLIRLLSPGRWATLSRPAEPQSWRYPFFVLATHPAIGADWAAAAGCNDDVIWFIRFHETDPDPHDPRFALMAALQDADAAS